MKLQEISMALGGLAAVVGLAYARTMSESLSEESAFKKFATRAKAHDLDDGFDILAFANEMDRSHDTKLAVDVVQAFRTRLFQSNRTIRDMIDEIERNRR